MRCPSRTAATMVAKLSSNKIMLIWALTACVDPVRDTMPTKGCAIGRR